ncbi:MAG: hypothetical protein U0414_09885 [Polyangiaceae bacterium]
MKLREIHDCTPSGSCGASATTVLAAPRDLVGPSDRTAYMIAAMGFLDGVSKVSSMTALGAWLSGDIVANGWASPWHEVREAGCSPVGLDARGAEGRMLIQMARRHVLAELRAFVNDPSDGLALSLIQRGCLQRRADSRGWVPWISSERDLSELVLALFAAAWIGDPEGLAAKLCLCDECDGVSFAPQATGRRGCPTHPDLRTAAGTLLRPW